MLWYIPISGARETHCEGLVSRDPETGERHLCTEPRSARFESKEWTEVIVACEGPAVFEK